MDAVVGAKFGHVRVRVEEGAVTGIHLSTEEAEESIPEGFPSYVIEAVRAYLEGRAPRPIAPLAVEGTGFQQEVWRRLADIPPGETRTYGELAADIGKPGAARAVGQALASNPLPLIWPCHRVTASDGLGGFGGCSPEEDPDGEGPLGIKRWLIEHEETL